MEVQPPRVLRNDPGLFPRWLVSFAIAEEFGLWGAADLRGFQTPPDASGAGFPCAIAFVYPLDPSIMAGVRDGPNDRYAAEYASLNVRINDAGERLSVQFKSRGYRALPLAASERTDTKNLKGDFPHKTAATRAGLGWVGRNCQLVTFKYGPWVRLGTVFTDMSLVCGPAVERDFCGRCNSCVEACPASALTGEKWKPGVARDVILDATACDLWKREHYSQFHAGHNCGICSAACLFGQKSLRRRKRKGAATGR